MSTPADLAARWARQWQNPDLREARLLDDAAWPVSLSIRRPTGAEVAICWQDTADRIRLWRGVRAGTVRWEMATYRATGGPIEIPVAWELASADDWAAATPDRSVRHEYEALRAMIPGCDPAFHPALVRERALWRNKSPAEVLQCSRLVMLLEPGCARGMPLRALSLAGIDSKFFERHRSLILRFLDLRYDGEATRQGLETFLDAWREQDHWLLVVDLGREPALPFPQVRVRAGDLAGSGLPARRLLIVENENCLHLLPRDLPGTIAVLGTGNNLAWLGAPWIRDARVGYWGDLDTWGLMLLARARGHAPHLEPLLMSREIFTLHAASAVPEKIPAAAEPPAGLTVEESGLYRYLRGLPAGRLEQEFLPPEVVQGAVRGWVASAEE